MADEQEYPKYVECPLVDQKIEALDCIETRDTINGNIGVKLESKYTAKQGYKDICRACKWYDVY